MNDQIDKIIYDALEEDIPTIDITSDNLLTSETAEAVLIAKESGVLSGISIMKRIFQILDDEIYIKVINYDETFVEEGDIIAIISGNIRTLLKGERLVLNTIGRMSAIATKTKKYVESVSDSFTKIIDTRNTTPNFRVLEQLAITHGGGLNYRSSLSSQVLIKSTHINQYSSAKIAIEKIYQHIDHDTKVAIEVNTFQQFLEVIHSKCDIIFLRDMNVDMIRKCVEHNNKKLLGTYESSIDNIISLSNTGIDFICVDELTHSYKLFKVELNMNK